VRAVPLTAFPPHLRFIRDCLVLASGGVLYRRGRHPRSRRLVNDFSCCCPLVASSRIVLLHQIDSNPARCDYLLHQVCRLRRGVHSETPAQSLAPIVRPLRRGVR